MVLSVGRSARWAAGRAGRGADDPSLLEATLTDGSDTASPGGAGGLRELPSLLVAFDLFFPVIEP